MTRHLQYLCACTCIWLLALPYQAVALEKWSRQLEASDPGVSDSFDWIPLAQPADSSTQTKDRSGNGRVLTYSQAFPSNGHFSDFAKGFGAPVSQKPSPFDFPFQFQNFGNVPQAQSLKQPGAGIKTNGFQSQDPTSQSFFKFEMPLNQQGSRLNNAPLGAASGVNTGYQISHAFGNGAQATLFNSPLFNQQPVFPPEFHPVPPKPQTQALQQKPALQSNFLSSEPISLKNFFKDNKPTPASPLQSVSPQVFPQVDNQGNSPFSLRAPFNSIPSGPAPSAPSPQQDNQFLYVPYNDIFSQAQPQSQPSVQQQQQPQVQTPVQQQQPQAQVQAQNPFTTAPKYSNNLPTVNPYQINQFYTPDSLGQQPQLKYFTTSTTTIRPQTTSLKPANIFQNFVNPQYPTTPKPKPKAHQPPLAMFLLRTSAHPAESDVVDILSSSKTISVIDSPTQNPPEIFVGPSGMPIPDGYTKFDLPYLSQLQGSQDINDVSFFVAPLSYRTPGGFNKILLPEPHVGSIVINLSKSGQTKAQVQYYQPQPQPQLRPQLVEQTTTTSTTTTTHRPRTSTQRVKSQHQLNRGNKFNYYYDQDPIQEVPSPQVLQKERPKKKRPQSVRIEQNSFNQQQLNNPYAQFNPIPNHISTDDFYKLQTKPSTTSTTSTTSTSSTTTSTTAAPQHYFAYNTHPQVEYPGGSGHLYPEINQIAQPVQEEKPRLTTRPPVPTTTAEEEYRMKQYYRKQQAHRQRPQVVAQTNPPYEQVQYTPVNLEYEISKTTTNKPRITFFSPTAAPVQDDDYNTVPPRQQQQQQPQFQQPQLQQPQLQQPQLQQPELQQPQLQQHVKNNQLPANHRPSYIQNEITDSPVEYEPNPYQLPSELPQLTPNFPGLVNNLKEMKDQPSSTSEQTTTTQEQTTVTPQEPESSTRPTRRPINRVRKPVATRVTSSVSYSESETFTRRPINRVRRPFGSRNTASTPSSVNMDYDETTTTTTRRPSSARNPLIRNPNRIRYQPTPEERQTLRIKPKRKYNSSGKVINENEDLDYQRDVLKQNYPVFKPNTSRRPSSSPTAIPSTYEVATTEAPTAETQQVYTVTPSNSIDNDNFPAGLLEPMQIAQYNEYKNNYGPGYFPNQEDVNPTEPVIRNEINPVYTTEPSTTPSTTTSTTTTTTTTTTEPPVIITTRRSPFIRRNYPRLRSTTTETPTTTTPAEEDKPATRNRLPPRKVIKVRARTRRPLHPASPTPAPEEDNEPTEQPKQNYRKLNRFNQDLYENDSPRRRYKQKFQLEGQESQWSPSAKVGPSNSFKPINPKETRNQHKFENEPEIVTAGSVSDNKENYEIKVSANYGPSANSMKQPNLKPEKSFAELLEEVMGKAPEDKPMETTMNPELSTDGTIFEAQKTTIANRILRRGKWKKTRISSSSSSANSNNGNGESFETAESQNLGSQLYNSLHNTDKPGSTTPMTTAAEINSMYNPISTTPMPITSMEEYSMSTVRPQESIATTVPMSVEETKTVTERTQELGNQEESATRRMDDDMAMEDDLEIQPSLFSEVKKQLHELFSIEESDDTAVTAALAAVGKRRQEYTHIKRPKVETTTASAIDLVSITEPMSVEDKKAFHRELMKHVVYATSSPVQQEETSEAEICYRGRCIKSEDLPSNHKLN